MGLENRNEQVERPEQIEQSHEQESFKRENLKKEFESSSDFDEVKSEKAEFSDMAEKQEKTDAAEKDEDMSDPDKYHDESREIAYDEAKVETAAEKVDSNGMSSNEVDIPQQELETAENVSSDYSSANELKGKESDSKESDCNNEINTDRTTPETKEDGETNVKEREPSEAEANSNENKDANNEKNKSDEIVSEESNPERTSKWYDSLPPGQIESHHGLESIAKEYAGKDSLSDVDKKELSDRQYDYLKDRQPEDRDDCRIPTPESIKNVEQNSDGTVRIEQNWKEGTDGAEVKSREMEIIKQGAVMDRIGSPDGKYFSPLTENDTPYSIEERATGDRLPEQQIENNSCYHKYEVKQDLTRENIENAITSHYPQDVASDKLFDLNQYYNDCCNDKSIYHDGDKYSDKTVEETDGIKAGKIDSMFRDDDGGGRQYIMPFSASEMCNLGLIEEI